MPFKCRVCDTTDFEEFDGHFICTECQTQTQDLIVQEVGDTQECNSRREVRHHHEDDHQATKKPKADLGRPWTIYEAYQIIILAQADSLVAQGAREDLKDVVFTIWANYLSKLGVAFCKKEKVVPDIVTEKGYGRPRELHRGTLSNPLNRFKKPLTQTKESSCLREEEFYEGDNPVDEEQDSIVFINEYLDFARGKKYKSRWNSWIEKSPEWMTMNKTVAICYIGLMFTNPNILPCDIVRFVYEGKVPFLSVTHLLPSDMVLSSSDSSLFRTSRFDTSTFIPEINRLLAYLKLDKMPRPDLCVIIPRFVQELCLPEEFVSFSFHLMEKVPFLWYNAKKTAYLRQEMVAVAYIVLAVKIALGLDDSTELKLSKYSKKLQNLLNSKIKLFVWSDWKNFMMLKNADEFNACREITNDISKSKLKHLDEFLECYARIGRDKRKLTTGFILNRNKHLRRCYQAEFRNSLRIPLEIALDRLQSDEGFQQDAVSRSRDAWATRGQEFHDCTMGHIADISLFQQLIGEMSPKNKAVFEKLLEKYSLPRTEVLQYDLIKDDDRLESHRHESYLWLLHLASEMVGCPVMELDRLVIHLLNYLVTVSRGELKPGHVCSQYGTLYASETLRKEIQRPPTC